MKNKTRTHKFLLTTLLPLLVTGMLSFALLSLKPLISETHFVPLGEHLAMKSLETQIKGLGGHQGNCVEISLKNLTAETLYVAVEPGRRLVAKDSIFQDILLVKERQVIIQPFATIKIGGVGFCCQSDDCSPAKDSSFSTGYMAPASWIELAKVINENNFPQDAIQDAVWIMSNNHSLASMYNPDLEKIRILRETVAKIKGITLPWYSITYEMDSTKLFSGKPEFVRGRFAYAVNKNAIVTINVKSKNGILMKTLVEAATTGPGKFTYDLQLPVKNWPKGEYTISVYEDYSNLNAIKKFEL